MIPAVKSRASEVRMYACVVDDAGALEQNNEHFDDLEIVALSLRESIRNDWTIIYPLIYQADKVAGTTTAIISVNSIYSNPDKISLLGQ